MRWKSYLMGCIIFLIFFLLVFIVAPISIKPDFTKSVPVTPPIDSSPVYALPVPTSNLMCGDCDGDGFITISDARKAAYYSSGLANLTEQEFIACNNVGIPGGRYLYNSYVSILDALTIARYTVGLVPSLNCGRPIYFLRSDDTSLNSSIWRMNSDGTGEVLIKAPVTGRTRYGDVVLSQDSTKIAYNADIDTGGNKSDIYVADSDGQNERRLTYDPEHDFNPSWSHDGSKIVFVTERHKNRSLPWDRNTEIYVMNSDGSNQTRLTNNSAFDRDPQWSPDGEKIVFTSDMSPSDFVDIYTMNPDGSNLTKLTNSTRIGLTYSGYVYPSWSPDSKRILFSKSIDPPPSPLYFEIYTMNVNDKSNLTLVLNTTDIIEKMWWSFDGRILYHNLTDLISYFDIYRMDEFGGNIEQLSNTSDWDVKPSH